MCESLGMELGSAIPIQCEYGNIDTPTREYTIMYIKRLMNYVWIHQQGE
jgi:hypothetical protein